MKDFTAVNVDPEFYGKLEAAKAMVGGNERLIEFKPPNATPGLSEEEELFRTFFQYTDEESRFKYVNNSSVCGYEVWIEDREIDFAFYVPNEELEEHYKKQLDIHYDGCQLGPKRGKMVDIDQGDYLVSMRFQLDNHYFEPVKTKSSPAYTQNPYRSILGELSMDEDLSAMIQFLYKPAEKDWTQLHTKNVQDHADEVVERNSYESRFFGLRSEKVNPPSDVERESKLIKEQKDEKYAFYMDIRVILAGPDRDSVERHARQLAALYEDLYETPGGQRLVSDGYSSANEMKDITIDVAQRNPTYMNQPKAPDSYLHHRFSDNTDTLIMTLDELVSVAPIPHEQGFSNVSAIDWAQKPLEGAASGIGETWTPPSEEEEEEIRERLRGSDNSEQIDSNVKTPSGDPVREPDEAPGGIDEENKDSADDADDTESDSEGDESESSEDGEEWAEDIDEMLS